MQFRPPPLPLADGHYNMWRGFKVEEVAPSAEEVDIGRFREHCTVLMENNAEWGDFLLDLLAHRVQRPGERTELALLFLGSQGTGKTTFFQLFCQGLMHEHNFLITEKPEQITGKFHQLFEKIVVLWEEAESHDTTSAADRLKHLITAESEWTEKKCKDARKHLMCFLPVITANHLGRKSVAIEGSDRRWVVMRTGSDHLVDPDYFRKLFAAKGGMGDPVYMRAVYDYLRKRDISRYRNGRDWSKARPITETYRDLQVACTSPFERWLDHVAEAVVTGAYSDDDGVAEHFATPDAKDTWSDALAAEALHPCYTRWLQRNGYEHLVTVHKFQLELSALANGVPWCTKIKTTAGLRRYKVNSTGMVVARLGRSALPEDIRGYFPTE